MGLNPGCVRPWTHKLLHLSKPQGPHLSVADNRAYLSMLSQGTEKSEGGRVGNISVQAHPTSITAKRYGFVKEIARNQPLPI